MPFATAQAGLEHYRAIEGSARRTQGQGAIHPDQCPKLLLHGVDFAIPPRGARIAPSFADDGTITVSQAGEDEWPQADELLQTAPMTEYAKCPQCGQAKRAALELDLQEGADFLQRCFGLASEALRKQYELTDAQLADLLGFAADEPPQWIAQLLRWCSGLSTEAPAIPPDEAAWREVLGEDIDNEIAPPTPKPWWKFWK